MWYVWIVVYKVNNLYLLAQWRGHDDKSSHLKLQLKVCHVQYMNIQTNQPPSVALASSIFARRHGVDIHELWIGNVFKVTAVKRWSPVVTWLEQFSPLVKLCSVFTVITGALERSSTVSHKMNVRKDRFTRIKQIVRNIQDRTSMLYLQLYYTWHYLRDKVEDMKEYPL